MFYRGYIIETNGAIYRAYKPRKNGKKGFLGSYLKASRYEPDITTLQEMKNRIDQEIAHWKKFSSNWRLVKDTKGIK